MSDFSRRSFMQMLGLGGIGLVAAKASPVPLFGSDDVKPLIVPQARLLKGHYVVQRKGFIERIPPEELKTASHRYGTPVARLTRTRVPGGGSLHGLHEHRLFVEGVFPEGVDPHVVYYRASNDMRAQFQRLSRIRLQEIPPELRASAVLVTVVESPILALAGEGRTGFDVSAYFRQGIRYSTEGLKTFQVYSEQGEYPIEVPRNIDIALLMKMDREILADCNLLVGDPRRWRPGGRRLWPGNPGTKS